MTENNKPIKLEKKIEITGKIICKTGLHIGGSITSLSIGGIDKTVVRNPLDNKPYIPGSSLKGKLRALFQIANGYVEKLEKPIGEVEYGPTTDKPDAELFGNASGDKNQIPSRIIIRDCILLNGEEILEKTEMPYTEVKTEVVIDRITSKANPRQIERVPAGAEFSLNIILNIWEQDNNKNELLKNLFQALELLKDDYLGGSGSRGYGQVSIVIEDIIEKDIDKYYVNQDHNDKKHNSIKQNYEKIIERLKN